MSTTQQKANEEGSTPNPFAKGGIPRSPPKKAVADAEKIAGKSTGTPVTSAEEVMDGPSLIRAVKSKRVALPLMVALSEQLDAIIEFTASRNNIAKDLKQGLYLLRNTVREVRCEHTKLEARVVAAERGNEKATKSVQTAAFTFAGDYTMAHEATEYSTNQNVSAKRPRQSPGKTVLGEAKRVRTVAPNRQAGTVAGQSPGKSAPEAAKQGKGVPNRRAGTVAGSSQVTHGDTQVTEKPLEWVLVGSKKNKKDRQPSGNGPKKPAKKRSKGDALILKTEKSQYSEVLKAMRGNIQLRELGADVRSIRRSRTGDMILELKKDSSKKGLDYKELAEKVLGGGVQVRALTSETTIQLKNLDEVTEKNEVAQALKEQCKIEVPEEAVYLRKGPSGTQVATVRLPGADGNKALQFAKLKIGWSICPVSIYQPPDVCYRCFQKGHKSWSCTGPDRSDMCRRCGGAGHMSRECKKPPKCLLCAGKPDDKHMMGSAKCVASRPEAK